MPDNQVWKLSRKLFALTGAIVTQLLIPYVEQNKNIK